MATVYRGSDKSSYELPLKDEMLRIMLAKESFYNDSAVSNCLSFKSKDIPKFNLASKISERAWRTSFVYVRINKGILK